MVIIDHHLCAYCGGCVSVCPVEALTLAETRLQVTVGNAGGVTLWLDGTMLPALGRSGDVVRDLILPAVRNNSPSSGPALGVSKSS